MNYTEAAALLRGQDHILILTHKRPDGDTIGCAVALCQALREQGKIAAVLPNEDATSLFTPYLEGYLGQEGTPDAPGPGRRRRNRTDCENNRLKTTG